MPIHTVPGRRRTPRQQQGILLLISAGIVALLLPAFVPIRAVAASASSSPLPPAFRRRCRRHRPHQDQEKRRPLAWWKLSVVNTASSQIARFTAEAPRRRRRKMATAGGGQDECQGDGEGRELRRRPSLLEQTRPSRLQKLADEGRKLPEPPEKKRPDPIYMYSSLVAGVGSGAMASILCAPIDLVRVRMQVWGSVLGEGGKNQQGAVALIGQIVKEIRTREGPKGFFRGLGATLLTVPAFWGVYFPLYDDAKRKLCRSYPDVNPSWIHMSSAVFAGIVSDVICNPAFVVRVRLQTEALHDMVECRQRHLPADTRVVPKTIMQTAQSLYKEGGLPIFWRGMTANILGLSHVAVQFPVYEKLKKRLRADKRHESASDLLLASSLSKMTASLLTYPHEVIRSRMMDARAAEVGFVNTCRLIYAKEGFLGFYAGLPVSLIRVLPNTCVTFLSYELLLRWARSKIRERSLSTA